MTDGDRKFEQAHPGKSALDVFPMEGSDKACPRCDLQFNTLLHPFCQHRYCPPRDFFHGQASNGEPKANLPTGSPEAGLSQAGLVDALEPFAALADQLDRIGCDDEDWVGEEESVTLQAKYYRAARQALSKIQPKGDLS